MRHLHVSSMAFLMVLHGCVVTSAMHTTRIRGEDEALVADARVSLRQTIDHHERVRSLVESLKTNSCTQEAAKKASDTVFDQKSVEMYRKVFLDAPESTRAELASAAHLFSVATQATLDVIEPAMQKCKQPGSELSQIRSVERFVSSRDGSFFFYYLFFITYYLFYPTTAY